MYERQHHILVDGRTAVNYTMFAPVHRLMAADDRVRFHFTASEEPEKARAIFAGAGPDASIVSPWRAALMRFDAYLTSDFTWTRHLHRPCRIQMFHGVAGKYGFDAPTTSMTAWDRLFFVNRRRLRNFIAAGAIAEDSPAIRLTGMPKVDCLVDGSLRQATVLEGLELDPSLPTVLYAPTWSPASSLNRFGLELIQQIAARPVNLIVKLHDRSLDPRPQYSGGIDWVAALSSVLVGGRAVLAPDADICPYLMAADVMITDHSSCGFEYLLLDRPLIRVHVPELIALANIHPDYVDLLASASMSVGDVETTIEALERALADPRARSAQRQFVARDLFYAAGTATLRVAAELYEAVELPPPAAVASRLAEPVRDPFAHEGTACQPSA